MKIPLPEPLGGHGALSGVLGIPEWWPTGSRVALVLAHGADTNMNDPLIEYVQSHLTEKKFLTLRFNFPFAEGARRKKKIDDEAALDRAFRAAIALLGRDPSATPAHLFLGGVGLGARVASTLAAELPPIEGVCLLGYPLHEEDQPETARPEALFRIVSPMLFIQGAHDPTCDISVLQRAMSRVGAPTTLRVSDKVGRSLRPVESAVEEPEIVYAEIFETLYGWLGQILREE